MMLGSGTSGEHVPASYTMEDDEHCKEGYWTVIKSKNASNSVSRRTEEKAFQKQGEHAVVSYIPYIVCDLIEL